MAKELKTCLLKLRKQGKSIKRNIENGEPYKLEISEKQVSELLMSSQKIVEWITENVSSISIEINTWNKPKGER